MTMQSDELKLYPCRFCGALPIKDISENFTLVIACPICEHQTKNEVRWNARNEKHNLFIEVK